MFIFIDFDSTIVSIETLDLLAKIKNLTQDKFNKIKELTEKAMNGEMSFYEALTQRLQLLNLNTSDIKIAKKEIVKYISKSALKEKQFFKDNNCYVLSGGFREIIEPVAFALGISLEKIISNEFIYENNKIVGADKNQLVAHSGGKPKAVQKIVGNQSGIMIGDGFTDAEVKIELDNFKFIAYTEFARRDKVLKYADLETNSFEKIVEYIKCN